MVKTKAILSLLLGSLIVSAVYAQTPGQSVAPKQFFPSNELNVYSPDSVGWLIAGMASYGISFAKGGSRKGESYGAQAILFEMAPTKSNEELIDIVKTRIAAANPPPRFKEVHSDYEFTESRAYPCVNVRAVFDDYGAVKGEKKLTLQVIALYCQHPTRQELGFLIAYSHRGKKTIDKLEVAAISFIEGVNVPSLDKQTELHSDSEAKTHPQDH